MYANNRQLTLLSQAERAALYDVPEFDDDQRLDYFNFTNQELEIINNRPGLVDKVHCAIQIGYFKAKHLFFRLTWEESQEDVTFILQQYFQETNLRFIDITDHEYYVQCREIASLFEYHKWSKDKTTLLENHIKQTLRRDVSPEFIVMELISFLKENKIMRPGYTTLQTIISNVLTEERKRLNKIIHDNLSDSDKLVIKDLLIEQDNLSDLAELKQDAKDFKMQMLVDEIDKLNRIRPLYQVANTMLPKLKISHQNIAYYASLADYYTIYDLREEIKPWQSQLYVLCYIWLRYRKLNDNLFDAFQHHLKRLETAIRKETKESYAEYAIAREHQWRVMHQLATFFIDDTVPDHTYFGDVRRTAFTTVITKDALLYQIQRSSKDLDKTHMDFKWQVVDKLFRKYMLYLRPLIQAIDLSSLSSDCLWLSTINEFKALFSKGQDLSKLKINEDLYKSLPKQLQNYLLENGPNDSQKLYPTRYEYWIYRRVGKLLRTGDLYLEDSIQNRSLQIELEEAKEKYLELPPLDIPAIHTTIEQLLDDRFAELDELWIKLNQGLHNGDFKHLHFEPNTSSLHLQKIHEDKVQKLQHHFYEQLARRDVAEIIRFVNEQCHFASAFTHIQPRYAKIEVDKKGLTAAIIAQGLNNGNLEMAEICDIPYDSLLDIYQSRFRLLTLEHACALVIEDIAAMSIFPFYTLDLSILYASVDGQKFAVERPNLKARYSKKYYAKGKGVVAYTMLCNHLPLQVNLTGPHEHESYYAFDILYNNATSIDPEVLTGDMHIINKLNFAFMDWFGKKLYSRFCSIQRQVPHLYCGKDIDEYINAGALVLPAGQLDRQLMEEEWHNILPIIKAVGVKEMSQSTLIRKLCTTKSSRTRRAMLEYDKLIRSITTLQYIQDRKLQKDIHRSQNRIESYHQLRTAITTSYGKKHLIGKNEKEIAISNQCGRLIALCILHYNSSILSKLYDKYRLQNNQRALNFIKKISPAAWRHIHFQGHFIFATDGSIINLDEVIGDLIETGHGEDELFKNVAKVSVT